MGHTFTSLCKLWTILQEILAVYAVHDGRPLHERVPLAFAESKFQRLLSWADALVLDMARAPQRPGHVLVFW